MIPTLIGTTMMTRTDVLVCPVTTAGWTDAGLLGSFVSSSFLGWSCCGSDDGRGSGDACHGCVVCCCFSLTFWSSFWTGKAIWIYSGKLICHACPCLCFCPARQARRLKVETRDFKGLSKLSL